MSKRLLSVLAFALVVSLGATFVVYRLISSQMSTSAKPATTQVMVAARNLPVGTMIAESDVKTGEWSGSLPGDGCPEKGRRVGPGSSGEHL